MRYEHALAFGKIQGVLGESNLGHDKVWESLKELEKDSANITEAQLHLIAAVIESAMDARARVVKREIIKLIESSPV